MREARETRLGSRVKALDADHLDDFFRVHSKENGEGWCNCVAWHVPTWEGWGERTEQDNLGVRKRLFAEGEFDGYILYQDDEPVGWCQCGPRDRLPKLLSQKALAPSAETWAITCFVIIPPFRGKGIAHACLERILEDLRDRGIRHVQAFPKCGQGLGAGEVWTGPESLYVKAGFELERPSAVSPVYGKRLAP